MIAAVRRKIRLSLCPDLRGQLCLQGHELFETSVWGVAITITIATVMMLVVRRQGGWRKRVGDHHELGRAGFAVEKGPAA
ncbi:MAG: hypothetical protein WBF43_02190 [Methylocella sp.]